MAGERSAKISLFLAVVSSLYVAGTAFQSAILGNTRNHMRSISRPTMKGVLAMENDRMACTWSPQDLTKDISGRLPIPSDDYIKKYQKNPELWPVEFFLITYRRVKQEKQNNKAQTQILVRKSANGTSKWGLGTGVPVTRWLLSTLEPPVGYAWSKPQISFEASNFPEYDPESHDQKTWTYNKMDIRADAFNGLHGGEKFQDEELEKYANDIRNLLKIELSEMMKGNSKKKTDLLFWESTRIAIVKNIVDNQPNTVAAIQGMLRMGGLFALKKASNNNLQERHSPDCSSRYIDLNTNAPNVAKLVNSMRIYTMFPQMPSPMPLPSTPPEELQEEIKNRQALITKSGRDPHQDEYGRKYTHISTSNVSNTIIGVYLTLDATGLPGLDDVPALDLFGTKHIKREWKSLEDLKVLDLDGKSLSTEDPKPKFISGFIIRQLVKDGVINIHG